MSGGHISWYTCLRGLISFRNETALTKSDFHELFHYNFSTPPPALEVPRPAHSTREACRLIMMELRVTHQEKPGPDDGQDLPIVHFTGDAHLMSSGLDPNANSKLTGTVRQTKEGEIRWTTLSVYGGFVYMYAIARNSD